MSMPLLKKTVRFSAELDAFTYERPATSEIYKLYYQEHDYRRFREEKWLHDLRNTRAQVRKTASPERPSRRDSLNVAQGPRSSSHIKKQRGIAQAA